MEVGLKIGHEVNKQGVSAITQGIVTILKQHADQETLRTALEIFGRSVTVQNVSIIGCTITGDKTINQ